MGAGSRVRIRETVRRRSLLGLGLFSRLSKAEKKKTLAGPSLRSPILASVSPCGVKLQLWIPEGRPAVAPEPHGDAARAHGAPAA